MKKSFALKKGIGSLTILWKKIIVDFCQFFRPSNLRIF